MYFSMRHTLVDLMWTCIVRILFNSSLPQLSHFVLSNNCRWSLLSSFRTFPVLALNVLHPKKPLHSRHTGLVGYPLVKLDAYYIIWSLKMWLLLKHDYKCLILLLTRGRVWVPYSCIWSGFSALMHDFQS